MVVQDVCCLEFELGYTCQSVVRSSKEAVFGLRSTHHAGCYVAMVMGSNNFGYWLVRLNKIRYRAKSFG